MPSYSGGVTRHALHPIDAAARGARRLSRGITATWWYTAVAIVFFELVVLAIWTGALADTGPGPVATLAVVVGGLVWIGSTVALLASYRDRTGAAPPARRVRALAALPIAVAYGAVLVSASGVWVLAALPLAQSLVLLNWLPGLRLRVTLALTLVLGALWWVDLQRDLVEWSSLGFYAVLLPAMTVASLWWWDVLITLDRARAAEGGLAATQERLRVATDVHDLQGHHLQVIALQLELAERLMARDPEAALLHLQAARASVDEARQGTRDLATRFRAVPLGDEIANAADLLRAAGIAVETSVVPDVDHAPGEVFGPVIRETTTNVLRHGGGGWARLSLTRVGASWRYEISNDSGADAPPVGDGSGLEGLARRAAEAGGILEVRRGRREFGVSMTVPAAIGVGQ